jgi:hypothetical protein
MRAPELAAKLDYDPEASMCVALSNHPDTLAQVAELIRSALNDPALLRAAME